MLRSISSRRLSFVSNSLLVLSSPRSFSSSLGPDLKSLSLQPFTRQNFVQAYSPRGLWVSKASFSASQFRQISDAKRKAKFEEERQNALKQKLEVDPENVTSTSSLTPIFDPKPKQSAAGQSESGDDPDMLRGLKSDLRTISETFELGGVPKEVLYIGMGGLIPYLGTSISTLYLAWDINYSTEHGIGYLVSGDTAGHLLHILEPLQVGLGAIILSFLGAVHWGLEMAEYGGKHTYKRYSLSILAPMLAWPTLLLPLDYALLAQFVGFTGMYFADSTATSKGWAPRWYMTYRFLLTFVVGASIVMTLVGRGQIGDRVSKIPGPASYLQDLRDSQWDNLQQEEDERRRTLRKEEMREKAEMERIDTGDETNDGVKEPEKGGNDEVNKNKPAADPGTKTKGDSPSMQGVYSDDDKQGSREPKSDNSIYEHPEPTGEKKVIQKPKLERKENNPGATKTRA